MTEEKKTTGTRNDRRIGCAALFFALTSLVASGISAAMTHPRTCGSMDYLGIIIAVLSLVTVFIVGYQIYNAVELKGQIKKLSDETKLSLNALEENRKNDLTALRKEHEGEKAAIRLEIVQAKRGAIGYANRLSKFLTALTFGEIYSMREDYRNASAAYADAFITAHELKDRGFMKLAADSLKPLMDNGLFDLSSLKRTELLKISVEADKELYMALTGYFASQSRPESPK